MKTVLIIFSAIGLLTLNSCNQKQTVKQFLKIEIKD
jgi:hypothetical protein